MGTGRGLTHPSMQEKTKHKLFLSLQFMTSDFGFSLLTKERKKERKMGEELRDKIWDDDKHSSATSIQEWMTS
jgi:hypothetical protein